MDRLDTQARRWRRQTLRFAGSLLFFAGLSMVAAGGLSVVQGRLDPLMTAGDATLWSATIVGLVIPAVLLGVVVILGDPVERRGAAIGTLIAVVGLGLLWLLAPAGWSGGPTATVAPALGVYAVGVLWLLVSMFGTLLETQPSDVPGVSVTAGTMRSTQPAPAVGDGGDEDDDLRFLLDEDED